MSIKQIKEWEGIAQKFSLPRVPDMIVDVNIPAGQNIQASIASAIFKGAENGGGGVQFQIMLPKGGKLKDTWFSNPRSLK